MQETTFEKIQRKTGRKPTECKCTTCQHACKHQVCLATPLEIARLIKAGYGDKLSPTTWGAGRIMGLVKYDIDMVQAEYDQQKGSCTFFTNGLCELHDKGLKPTEGRLAHHSIAVDNFDPHKSIAWNVAKEWINVSDEVINEFQSILK